MAEKMGEIKLAKVRDLKVFDGLFCSLKNQRYDCQLSIANGEFRSIRKLFDTDDERLPAIGRIGGIYRMHPYNWPVEQFVDLPGVDIVSVEQSEVDADILIAKCTARVSQEESPLAEPADGSWEFEFSQSRKVITRQFFTKNENSTALLEFQVDDTTGAPTDSLARYDFKYRNKDETIEYKLEFLDLAQDHQIPEKACYLSFFGLPELDGVKLPGGWKIRFWK